MTRWCSSFSLHHGESGGKKVKTAKKAARVCIQTGQLFLRFPAFLVLHGKHALIFYQIVNQRNNGQNECYPDQDRIQDF